MHRLSRPSDYVSSLAAIAVVLWQPFLALGIEPLPVDIPAPSPTVAELVKQSAQAVERIENVRERINVLAVAIFEMRMRGMSREETLPLDELLTREVAKAENQDLVFERIGHLQPEILLQLIRQLPEGRRRDQAIHYLVGTMTDLDVAQEFFREIKNPADRLHFAYRARNLDEAKKYLAEIKRLGWPPPQNSLVHTYGTVLARFAAEHFDEVIAYIRSELPSNDAVEVLGSTASHFDYLRKQPQTAARIFKVAAELVPECKDSADATRSLLRAGYPKHFPQEAVELFDRFFSSTIKGQEKFSTIADLAPAGLDVVVKRAEEIAPATYWSKPKLVAEVVKGSMWSIGPDAVLQWLHNAPTSLARDMSIASVALYLDHYGDQLRNPESGERAWVEQLVPLVPHIDNSDARRQASQHLIRLARKASITVPQSVRDDCARLSHEYLAGVHEDRFPDELRNNFEFLQPREQLQHIEREFEKPELQNCAYFIRRSSLSIDEKNAWYIKMLAAVHNIADHKPRACALSGLGGDLWETDPQQSLPVLWESLRLARDLQMQPIPVNIDDGPGYHGWRYPPTTADEAFGPTSPIRSGNGQIYVEALWAFARRLETQDDRDAVLEALGKRLVVQKDNEKAAGVAFLMNTPVRQARLFAAIAVAKSGKRLPE